MTLNHNISQIGIGLDFPLNFEHLATSLRIDKINGDCQDYQRPKNICRAERILLLFINWLLEVE